MSIESTIETERAVSSSIVMRNDEILAAFDAISILALEKINMDATMQIRHIRTLLSDLVAEINGVKKELLDEFGEMDVDGHPSINVTSPRWLEFVPHYNDLMAVRVEIFTTIQPISVTSLWRRDVNGARQTIDVSGDTLFKLGPFLVENSKN